MTRKLLIVLVGVGAGVALFGATTLNHVVYALGAGLSALALIAWGLVVAVQDSEGY